VTPAQVRVSQKLRDLVYAIEIPSHLSVGLRRIKPFRITLEGEGQTTIVEFPERIITDAEAKAWENSL